MRPLCPTPSEQAHGPDWLEHTKVSPLHAAAIPPGANRNALINTLDSAVEHQQPGRVVAAIARDSVRLFALTRDQVGSVTPIARWQFQNHYAVYPPWVSLGKNHAIIVGVQKQAFSGFQFRKIGRAQVDRPVAAFLRSYQLGGGYTPGPLLALFTLAGLIGSVLALLRRAALAAGSSPWPACCSPSPPSSCSSCPTSWNSPGATAARADHAPAGGRARVQRDPQRPPGAEPVRGERVIATSDVAWVPGAAAESPDSP